MQCECGEKMKCRFTVALGPKSRYRAYRCACGQYSETVEVLYATYLEHRVEHVGAIVSMIDQAKHQRYRFSHTREGTKG